MSANFSYPSSPSSAALIHELSVLPGSNTDIVNVSLQLLEMLVEKQLSDDEHAQILVPDESGHLCPIAQVYFNDIGPRAINIAPPGNLRRAHSKIDYRLAEGLRLMFIGHSELKPLFEDDDDMSEPLTTRITNVLRQYDKDQFFGEFLANAHDAKATVFGMLLDETPAPKSNVLSPALAELQAYPSLIIYNNSIFEERDFKGIRKVGQGGKVGRFDTIGQFGLGSLAMYHFTEVSLNLVYCLICSTTSTC
jgi:hypothetical protein